MASGGREETRRKQVSGGRGKWGETQRQRSTEKSRWRPRGPSPGEGACCRSSCRADQPCYLSLAARARLAQPWGSVHLLGLEQGPEALGGRPVCLEEAEEVGCEPRPQPWASPLQPCPSVTCLCSLTFLVSPTLCTGAGWSLSQLWGPHSWEERLEAQGGSQAGSLRERQGVSAGSWEHMGCGHVPTSSGRPQGNPALPGRQSLCSSPVTRALHHGRPFPCAASGWEILLPPPLE